MSGTVTVPQGSSVVTACNIYIKLNGQIVNTLTYNKNLGGGTTSVGSDVSFTTSKINLLVPNLNSILEFVFENYTTASANVVCSLHTYVITPTVEFYYSIGKYALNSSQFFCLYGSTGLLVNNDGVYKITDSGDTLTPI